MAFDITAHNPAYDEFSPSWELMRLSFDGEDAIKAAGARYLPVKNGIAKLMSESSTRALAMAAYDAYKARAEFPDLVALTVRGAVGTILDQAAEIELPSALEPLREKATRDGLTLEALHRRIATDLMTVGRYGILPGIDADGKPYLAGYVSETGDHQYPERRRCSRGWRAVLGAVWRRGVQGQCRCCLGCPWSRQWHDRRSCSDVPGQQSLRRRQCRCLDR